MARLGPLKLTSATREAWSSEWPGGAKAKGGGSDGASKPAGLLPVTGQRSKPTELRAP